VFNLGTSYSGDRYTAPHTVLTSLNRGSTPKYIPTGVSCCNEDLELEEYEDRDLFGEIVAAMGGIGVKVIGLLPAESPAMLQTGEDKAYDYNDKSPFVNSCEICPGLVGGVTMEQPFCDCAPSVWRWKNWVKDNYSNDNVETLKRAFAEVIVGEFAERYKEILAGFWIDQANVANIPLLDTIIKHQMPRAVVAYSHGQRLPLTNNNPPYEDYTFGYPYHDMPNVPASDCINFKAITGQENTTDGYYYAQNHPSLGHVFFPVTTDWSSGNILWDLRQARDWQGRFMNAGGAWTWNVRRGTGRYRSLVLEEDLEFLEGVYEGLEEEAGPPYWDGCEAVPSSQPSLVT